MKNVAFLTVIFWLVVCRAFAADLPVPKHHKAAVHKKSLVIGKSALPKDDTLNRPAGMP